MMKRVDWQDGIWSNEPHSVAEQNGKLIVQAVEGSDYWQKTMYGFQHDNGHALLAAWTEGTAVEVSFDAGSLTELYDQAGIMLWHSPLQWIKAGVEINDGVPHIGAVVTDQYSDWSLSPVPEWAGQIVTIRASRLKDAVILRARTGAHPWRTIRVARFPYTGEVQAGPMLCAPTRPGLRVEFTSWISTSPDTDVHDEPPGE
ncbi:regulation of enolase protein 1 (concanavalin A-like superfamily) [Paenibacillus sp. PastF-1]|nr:regulation of enolase protein 1 (concanavalin A-like superfamily) [Paenibacillus sp. PastF-1]MDH6479436.1 regulation of enolase protein 1 (concanavalin A-like superfamily) [Paenibacillus sp. PastH-2]MDH6505102.1 regulation of enolase protein 1 (concanavalin A-like superfamily) [Paenibacillus sp. PastM-3]